MLTRVALVASLMVATSGCLAENEPDYYTLAVTLTPAFCELNANKSKTKQCRNAQPLSVHGLWPESASTRAPEYCQRNTPSLSSSLKKTLDPIMPDDGLRRYQWQKHGSCSGQSPERYFTMLHKEFYDVKWPTVMTKIRGRDQVIERNVLLKRIREANPGLPEKGVYLRCDKEGRPPYLVEVRICLTPQGQFTECKKNFRPNCPAAVKIKANS